MIYFTADFHFGHQNVIDYCKRPWTNANKMEQVLVANYRKLVTPEDTVYILGDLTLAGPQNRGYLDRIVEALPGTKHFILGNHDKFNPFVYVDAGFRTVHTALDIGEFVLVHDPVNCLVDQTRKWLCGHVHNLFKMNRHGNVLNVGVDQWGYYPVSIEEVRKRFNETIVCREAALTYEGDFYINNGEHNDN